MARSRFWTGEDYARLHTMRRKRDAATSLGRTGGRRCGAGTAEAKAAWRAGSYQKPRTVAPNEAKPLHASKGTGVSVRLKFLCRRRGRRRYFGFAHSFPIRGRAQRTYCYVTALADENYDANVSFMPIIIGRSSLFTLGEVAKSGYTKLGAKSEWRNNAHAAFAHLHIKGVGLSQARRSGLSAASISNA